MSNARVYLIKFHFNLNCEKWYNKDMLTGSDLLLFSVVVFCGIFLQSVIGFGGNFFSVGLLALWLPVHDVIIILAAVFALNNLSLVWLNRKNIAWNEIKSSLVIVLVGAVIGAILFPQLNATVINIALGITIIGMNILQLSQHQRHRNSINSALQSGLLGGGGVIQGAIGTGGPLIVSVLSQRIISPSSFRGTVNVLLFCINGGRTLLYATQGLYQPSSWRFIGVGAILLLVVSLGGHFLANRLPDRVLRTGVTYFLLLIGVVLLLKSLT